MSRGSLRSPYDLDAAVRQTDRPAFVRVPHRLWLLLWEGFHIFFRHYNFPCKLGLRKIGNPDENSPVLVSGNYTLTVYRLLRVLRGFDCWLLVANSRGSNVWCAAGMNEYTEHDIVDAINVSRLSTVVKHRRIIAPPYAAPGVDAIAVKRETGFRLIWGPTHLDDIPRYLRNRARRTYDMSLVQFNFQDRMEQALSTATAYCLTIAIGLFFWPSYVLGAMAMVFIVYCYGFAMWNFYPVEKYYRRTALLYATFAIPFLTWGILRDWPVTQLVVWSILLLVTTMLMAMDGCGSSPVYKSTVAHWLKNGDYHSAFVPIIDPDMCTNCMDCQAVCPTDVFSRRRVGDNRMVVVNPGNCIECMACVKQCDDDAIFNQSGKYKGDVKSVSNIDFIMTRDWSHIAEEKKWIGMPTTVMNGHSVVVEDWSGRRTSGRDEAPAEELPAAGFVAVGSVLAGQPAGALKSATERGAGGAE